MSSELITSTKVLRESLAQTASLGQKWFEDRTVVIDKKTFNLRDKMDDNGSGAVYVYYKNDQAVYVGETRRRVKARKHDQTSPHKDKSWWNEWTHMRFCQISDLTDRLYLELLLIVAYNPIVNKKPAAKEISDFLFD